MGRDHVAQCHGIGQAMRDQLQRRGLVGWQMVFGDGQVQADAEDDADAFRCGSHISGTSRTVRDGSCGKRNHFGEHAAQFLPSTKMSFGHLSTMSCRAGRRNRGWPR